MEQLKVDLGSRSYPIFIGSGIMSDQDCFSPYIRGRDVMIVSNDTVAPLYLKRVEETLKGYNVHSVILKDGEQYKNLDGIESIITELLRSDAGRDVTLIALGGGVVGDMTGFAAACYQRGVDFIQCATTLLAHVDSSVGGKTGVNHPLGKNMIGAFHQPKAVVIDTDTLKTLDRRQLSAGLAEVIKYGIMWDGEFFSYLEENMDRIMALDEESLVRTIRTCCSIKAEVVHEDERESGVRALLNLGHTFGHAIECHEGYGVWLHGEGVAAGTACAARVAVYLGRMSEEDFGRITALLERASLPTEVPADMSYDVFYENMIHDKKVRNGRIRYVIPDGIGHAGVLDDIPAELISRAIEDLRKKC